MFPVLFFAWYKQYNQLKQTQPLKIMRLNWKDSESFQKKITFVGKIQNCRGLFTEKYEHLCFHCLYYWKNLNKKQSNVTKTPCQKDGTKTKKSCTSWHLPMFLFGKNLNTQGFHTSFFLKQKGESITQLSCSWTYYWCFQCLMVQLK